MTRASDPVQRTLALLAVFWAGAMAAMDLPAGVAGVLAAGGTGLLVLGVLARARSRRGAAVDAALAEARGMLQDRLSGHLHLLLRAAATPDRELDAPGRARLAEVVNAAREIEATVEVLSAESIRGWQATR